MVAGLVAAAVLIATPTLNTPRGLPANSYSGDRSSFLRGSQKFDPIKVIAGAALVGTDLPLTQIG